MNLRVRMLRCVTTGLVLLALAAIPAAQQQDKIGVCHRPPGNPSNVKLITVDADGLADHLSHGDHLSFEGGCYVYVAGPEDSIEAEQACIDDFGGHLASIHSEAEDDFISALVDPDAEGGITASIGGFEPGGFCGGPDAIYTWTDGSPWDYSNWRAPREPNCSGAGVVSAATQFWPNTNGTLSGWNDVPAEDPLDGFVCKYYPKH